MMHYIKLAVIWVFNYFGYKISRVKNPSLMTFEFEMFDEFVDSNGNQFKLLQGYKDRHWGINWEEMNEERAIPDVQMVKRMNIVNDGRHSVANMVKYLQKNNLSIFDKDVLDVGCFSGASTFALVEHGASHVDGIDDPKNFAELLSNQADTNSIEEESHYLKKLRKATGSFFCDGVVNKVQFYDLDVKNLTNNNCYDVIVSWAVLEHIIDPKKAIKSMYSALRSGGICSHDYHPFFCTSGAHFDTLDFPWGHVRLAPRDFDRYIQTYRPQEYAIAMKRFYKSINRMTLEDLRQFSLSAGFEILDLVLNKDIRLCADKTILSQCKALYPSLTINDLLTHGVQILLRKP